MVRKPTYSLSALKAAMKTPADMCLPPSAVKTIRELGLTREQAHEVIQNLQIFDFYKTMPCDWDATVHQDVYKPVRKGVELYVKFQEDVYLRPKATEQQFPVEERCFVVSFKRSEDEW
jgi:motility quorum-sensing regulator/GCU-specific mRNA interferase toxin